jgi:hypothetical protein
MKTVKRVLLFLLIAAAIAFVAPLFWGPSNDLAFRAEMAARDNVPFELQSLVRLYGDLGWNVSLTEQEKACLTRQIDHTFTRDLGVEEVKRRAYDSNRRPQNIAGGSSY